MLIRFWILTLITVLISCSGNGDNELSIVNNQPPVAVAEADRLEGVAPFKVTFNSEKSSDDVSITNYFWDLGKGIVYNEASPTHLFTEPGTYEVALTVNDEKGLKDTDSLSITVASEFNESPIAVANLNKAIGEAPLTVSFSGENSTDDGIIESFLWQFPETQSNAVETSYVFKEPGEYKVSLVVTDEYGLQGESVLVVTVTPKNVNRINCSTGGKKADEFGQKIWCWKEQEIPSGFESGGDDFSDGQLALSVECSVNQVVQNEGLLHFKLNPTEPDPASWCNNNFNLRSEIRTLPWKVNHPPGTEEWFGWTYGFSEDYIVDSIHPWAFFQVHEATLGKDPLIALWSMHENGAGDARAGEIYIVIAASDDRDEYSYIPTGVITEAGRQFSFVVHVVWGDGDLGLLQVWIDGVEIYNEKIKTIRADNPVGGNAKFGIYKWAWRDELKIQQSREQGIESIHTFMGPLRMITRRQNDIDYLKNSYLEVAPF